MSLCCSEVQGSRVLSITSILVCPFGTEKIAHELEGCIEEHWSDPEFAVLKVDLKNAFNVVSRQVLLVKVKNHFPELLP